MSKGLVRIVLCVKTVRSAHPVVRVGVLAPNPLYVRSPRRWAGSMFALDSLWAEAESRDPGDDGQSTVALDGSAPGLLVGYSTFNPGGSDGWENYELKFFVGLTNM